MSPKTFCLSCGELAEASYCDGCYQPKRREQRPDRTLLPHQRGYDSAWRRLSKKARKIQPFCSDCGRTTDLQADHSPEAWERHRQRRTITLDLIDVVCGDCNRARGDARNPGGWRSPGTTDVPGG